MSQDNVWGFTKGSGESLFLEGAHLSGVLRNELFELSIEQRFRNSTKRNLELIYTFPLAMNATLLDLDIDLNGKQLKAVAVSKIKAERQYEEAVSEGDSAILLEQSGEGRYTLNLGNIGSGETVILRYRTLEPLLWQQGTLRVVIPTTVAPIYGDPARDGVLPHQVAESDVRVEHPFSLQLDVLGRLAEGTLDCPSHALQSAAIEGGLRLSLRQGFLDRDFILNLEGTPTSSAYKATFAGKDYLWATYLPQIEASPETKPVHLGMLFDCSGSMSGDSIAHVREGALKILDQLDERDRFHCIRFGSEHERLFDAMQSATPETRFLAGQWMRRLQADMGGTETQNALMASLMIQRRSGPSDMLLVTDGDFYGAKAMVAPCREAGVRMFIIGVGSSPNHADLSHLAKLTGGSYEAVNPNEDIAKAIVRTVRRLRQDTQIETQVAWPKASDWRDTIQGPLYRNDMVLLTARYDHFLADQIPLEVKHPDHAPRIETIPIETWPGDAETLARLVVAQRIRRNDTTDAPLLPKTLDQMAVDFNLLTRLTHLLVVHEREVKAEDLPETIKVKNMLAAGWGGTSGIRCNPARNCSSSHEMHASYQMDFNADSSAMRASPARKARKSAAMNRPLLQPSVYEDIPLFLRIPDSHNAPLQQAIPQKSGFRDLIQALASARVQQDSGDDAAFLLELLLQEAPKALVARMQEQAAALGFAYIVAAMVQAVLASDRCDALGRSELRALLKVQKQLARFTVDPADRDSLQKWIETLAFESEMEASLAA